MSNTGPHTTESPRPMYGWELLYRSEKNNIVKKDDILILLIHWCLTNKGFRCIGIDKKELSCYSEAGSETLPKKWNVGTDGNYALQYILNRNTYTLCSTRNGDALVINLLRHSDHTVSSMALDLPATIKDLKGPIEIIVPEYKNVLNTIEKKLITPIHCTSSEVHTQTALLVRMPCPDYLMHPEMPYPRPRLGFDSSFDLEYVGRANCDPLPRTLLANNPNLVEAFLQSEGYPPRAGNLPQGFVSPGARFGPIGLSPLPLSMLTKPA